MARTSLRKRQAVSYNEDNDDDDEMPKVTKAVAAAGKAIGKTKGAISKAVTKRKAEPEAEIDAPAAAAAKTTKKRKTKKEEDSTPLADRTAISSLTPAMHIGAHVSAAGGSQSDSASARSTH